MGVYFWAQALGTAVLPPGEAHSRVETLSEVGGLLACSFRATTVTVYSSPGFSPVWLKVVTVLGSWAITPPSLFCQGMKQALTLPHQLLFGGGNDAQRGGAPRVASFHSPLCIPKSHGHLGTPQHGGRKMKSPTKRGALVLLGCKILPIPPPSPASVYLCLCCTERGKMIKPKPWLGLFSLLFRCQEPFVVDV